MGLYRWNSGGQYRGKSWEQDLLADSQVCNHDGSVDSHPLHRPGSVSEGSMERLLANAGVRREFKKGVRRRKAQENV